MLDTVAETVPMDLKQMQYFLCLAEQGNVTRAARQLNIVQPALSMQIARLEAEFGQKLFDRGAQGVSMTAAGARLMELIVPIVRDAESAMQEMARLKGRVSGRVSIGLITSVAQSILASSSAKVGATYRDVFLSTCEGYTDTLVDWVVSGQLDAAIVNLSRKRLPLTTNHILDEEMVLACRADRIEGPTKPLPFKQVAQFDLVLPSKRHGLRAILDNHAAGAGIDLKPRLELDTLPAICDVIATTDFLTVLPTIALRQHLAAGKLRARRFVGPRIIRSIAWVHHPRRQVSVAAKAVLDVICGDLLQAATMARSHIKSA